MQAVTGIVPQQLTLGVSDIDATERFYRDVVGFEMVRHGDSVRIEMGTFTLVFEHAPPTERAKFELGLRVADGATLDAIAQRVGTATYDRDGGRALFITDPDHYTIEIFAR
ncbi:MAG: putative Glyoxalase/bleomycin resistance protein/dioxygenase [Candidatus Eremiobacteraeota bacterium]|nr:putative Glyoxalase/bleomycin resistance protein/dioxygenase [Candidatus Eremiobacteraeota bacterium]